MLGIYFIGPSSVNAKGFPLGRPDYGPPVVFDLTYAQFWPRQVDFAASGQAIGLEKSCFSAPGTW